MRRIYKIVIVALVVFFSFNVTVSAQHWEIIQEKGDELKGTESTYNNFYITSDMDCFIIQSGKGVDLIAITTGRSIFDYEDGYRVKVIIGFYVGDKLERKETAYFLTTRGNSDTAIYSKKRNNAHLINDIINHIKTTGEIRLLAERYTGTDYDVTIPRNPDIKLYND